MLVNVGPRSANSGRFGPDIAKVGSIAHARGQPHASRTTRGHSVPKIVVAVRLYQSFWANVGLSMPRTETQLSQVALASPPRIQIVRHVGHLPKFCKSHKLRFFDKWSRSLSQRHVLALVCCIGERADGVHAKCGWVGWGGKQRDSKVLVVGAVVEHAVQGPGACWGGGERGGSKAEALESHIGCELLRGMSMYVRERVASMAGVTTALQDKLPPYVAPLAIARRRHRAASSATRRFAAYTGCGQTNHVACMVGDVVVSVGIIVDAAVVGVVGDESDCGDTHSFAPPR